MTSRLTSSKRFDDRQVDWASGRKVSPPMSERKICDCCGQRLVKGYFTNLGTLGDDCREVVKRAVFLNCFQEYAAEQARIGWSVKPAIARFLEREVYAN